MRLELRCGHLRVTLAPRSGGAVAGFWLDRPEGAFAILRPMPEAAGDALHAAMFPMLPFANCIRDNRFAFDGRTWQVEPNMTGTRLNFHGSGWRLPWQEETVGADHARLRLQADDGVWRYDAVQDYALDKAGLGVTLSVTNRGATAMPFGLGLHPWFARHAEALVQFSAAGFWTLSPEGEALSLGPVPPEHDHSAPTPMPRHSLNVCYGGWTGTAQVRWPGAAISLELRADPVMGRLMAHVPADDPGTFCLEPQSNPPCGFDRLGADAAGSGLHVLLPDETVAGRMSMNVSED